MPHNGRKHEVAGLAVSALVAFADKGVTRMKRRADMNLDFIWGAALAAAIALLTMACLPHSALAEEKSACELVTAVVQKHYPDAEIDGIGPPCENKGVITFYATIKRDEVRRHLRSKQQLRVWKQDKTLEMQWHVACLYSLKPPKLTNCRIVHA